MIIHINTNTYAWHFCWVILDFLIAVALVMGYDYLMGPKWLRLLIIAFMGYRIVYHGIRAWALSL